MREKTKISFADLNSNIQAFHDEMVAFVPERYETLKKKLASIKDDMGLILLESQDRYEERLQRRPALNKKIREENKKGPRKSIEEYISTHPHEFLETLEKKGLHMDDTGTMLVGKLKRGNKVPNVVSVNFVPKQLITKDQYAYVRTQLEAKERDIICQLTTMLEDAYAKTKNIYESYSTPAELFNKLGIKIQKVEYPFFAKDRGKEKPKLPGGGGLHVDIIGKGPCDAPKFKKIGYLMKYLEENGIPFRANNIIEDINGRYQFYFYQHDITILISDVVTNTGFRDATYIIKGIVPGLKNVNKEELRHYQGKKMMFSENRPRRIEGVFADDPENRPLIGEEKEESSEVQKTLINDRTLFISIIKEHFTRETLTGASYKSFAQGYNADPTNEFLLNNTISGCISLLGLGGKKGSKEIRDVIFENKKPKLEIPKDSYFSNEYIKKTLLAIQACEGFDPDKVLGASNYMSRTLDLVRKACKEDYVDAVANKSKQEKKKKLEEYTGIKNMPLRGLKITTMLGGRTRCVNIKYQKMLRKRFMLYMDDKNTSEEYKQLNKDILHYETTWEDEGLRPNSKKIEKKDKNIENPEKIPSVQTKKVKELQETTQSELAEALKDPITIESFPLYKVKSAKIIADNQRYRTVKAYNCPVELRLPKSSVAGNTFDIGEKIEIFGVIKNLKGKYINVNRERERGYHKVVEFLETHTMPIEKFERGNTYPGVVNNVVGSYVWVSINKNYSGRIRISRMPNAKIGDIVNVIFDGINHAYPNRVNIVY